eukprot:2322182-Pyramimonas_sp.AAC.1
MWSEDRAASPIHRRRIGHASAMQRRCTVDASPTRMMHRPRRRGRHRAPHRAAPPMYRPWGCDSPTPSTGTPSGRPRSKVRMRILGTSLETLAPLVRRGRA